MRGRLALVSLLVGAPLAFVPAARAERSHPDFGLFFEAAFAQDEADADRAFERIAESWRDGYAPMLVDIARFMRPARRTRGPQAPTGVGSIGDGGVGDDSFGGRGGRTTGGAGGFGVGSGAPRWAEHPSTRIRRRLVQFLERQTGQKFGDDLDDWRDWYWNRSYEPHPDYALFKGALYGQLVDPRMASFFPADGEQLIRLDEVDWGGVGPNGIPPLDHPEHISASEARYLKDKHIVFGIYRNGEARAYPKRILAWHEMALDRLGGTELTIVYCTLCGTVIPYGNEAGGRHWSLGTSGLLYRSNKLMFDTETMSLWSTVEGRPVIGSLAGEDIELPVYPVVTTTWRDWKSMHPDTTVLSLDTGFERDYDEGAAYRDYFGTDRLMFEVPKLDKRLKNKEEVLALLVRPAAASGDASRHAVALSAKFLKKKQNRLYKLSVAGRELVIITSADGANRVFESGPVQLASLQKDGSLRDSEGRSWSITEDALVPEAEGVAPLPRVPARRAFWFGWYAAFPETQLIK